MLLQPLHEEISHTAADSIKLDAFGRIAPRPHELTGLLGLAKFVSEDPSSLASGLWWRHRLRLRYLAEDGELLPGFSLRVGQAISAADIAFEAVGAPWSRHEVQDSDCRQWLSELRGGLDSYARIAWHLRFGHSFAAVALTRWYLERWTFNVAHSNDLERGDGEGDGEYFARVWDPYMGGAGGEVAASHWGKLSELLHGRSIKLKSTTISIRQDMSEGARQMLHNFIARAAEIPLRQVRVGIGRVYEETGGNDRSVQTCLECSVSSFKIGDPAPGFLDVFQEPLDFGFVSSPEADTLLEWGATYQRLVKGRASALPRARFLPTDSWMALEERWVRSIADARFAFSVEQQMLPDQFDPGILEGLLAQLVGVSEMADLIAKESPSAEGEALATVASALESAWILWLQDVDESLIAMRSALECIARARAFRIKPDKAERLLARGTAATTHRWVELAGWKRLSAFVRALGEFSHLAERSRHSGARSLLTNIQRNPLEGTESHTGRRNALIEVMNMISTELAERLDDAYPTLARKFREWYVLDGTRSTTDSAQAWLAHAAEYRGHDFGEPLIKRVQSKQDERSEWLHAHQQ